MDTNPFSFLRAATPYVRDFRGKTFVVKLGGAVLEDAAARRHLCDQLSLLHHFSIRLVVVHGGGNEADALCGRLGVPVEKIAGRRITSPAALEACTMVYAGSLHSALLAEMRALGLPCVGLSGLDAGLVQARRRPPLLVKDDAGIERKVDFGEVGDVEAVRPRLLEHLLEGGFVPLVAPLSGDDHGAIFNTNADTIATELAAALRAEKLFFLLEAPGLLRDPDDPRSLLSFLKVSELDGLAREGVFRAGMRPKIAATRKALAAGVRGVHMIGGLKQDALLREIFTNEGSGSMIVAG